MDSKPPQYPGIYPSQPAFQQQGYPQQSYPQQGYHQQQQYGNLN